MRGRLQQRAQPLHAQDQRARIDAAARGDDGAQARMSAAPSPARAAAAFAFSGSMIWLTIGMLAGQTSSHL